ncbi:long chain polyunsaturated fatty acid elongation enzyme, putative [Hepatocystis sp. ex Piliocolobus tephrosceles]|nr:long chain polyunsaturated fatty acid elongation enzyme, putative [Hepatocystis sp. ex Piliocolobus tephrosceles]
MVYNLNLNYINSVGESILHFFNPNLKYEQRITRNWFLIQPIPVFIISFIYITFLIVSYIYINYNISNENKKKLTTSQKQVADASKNAKSNNATNSNATGSILQQVVPIYNLIQFALSFIILVFVIYEGKKRNFYFYYNEFDASRKEIAFWCWIFYLNKVIDFFDTILIVLKKKWNQFSLLHTYHHFTVFIIMWINTAVGYDGDISYIIGVNSFVHCVMYFYYFLTSIKVRVPLLFKASVTYIQIVQFFSIIIPDIPIVYLNYKTPYPKRLIELSFYYTISLLILFLHFAYNTYFRTKLKKA